MSYDLTYQPPRKVLDDDLYEVLFNISRDLKKTAQQIDRQPRAVKNSPLIATIANLLKTTINTAENMREIIGFRLADLQAIEEEKEEYEFRFKLPFPHQVFKSVDLSGD